MAEIRLEVAQDRCKGCELCIAACPRDVLAIAGHINALGYRPVEVVALERCTGCGACYVVCPDLVFTITRAA